MYIGIRLKYLSLFILIIIFNCSCSNKNTNDIIWLDFSDINYVQERVAVTEWFQEDYEMMKSVLGECYYENPIFISTYDLNNDGKDEIIAFLSGAYWGGGNATGALYVLSYDGKNILRDALVANFQIDLTELKTSNNQIGIKENNNGHFDFIIHNQLWEYNGV